MNQLKPLSYLTGKGYGEPLPNEEWVYALPAERVASLASENSGDTILLANLAEGFHFTEGFLSKGLPGNHGGPTLVDGVVPMAFAFPGVQAAPDMLKPISEYFAGLTSLQLGGYVLSYDPRKAAEAQAIRAFFGVPQP